VKTKLISLLLSGVSLLAQVPPSAAPPPADAPASPAVTPETNREEILRQAVRRTIDGTPGTVAPSATIVATGASATVAEPGVQVAAVPLATPSATNAVAAPVVPSAAPPGIPTTPVPTIPTTPVPSAPPTQPPGTPIVPGAQPGVPLPGSTPPGANVVPDAVIQPGEINFQAVDLQQVLTVYADLVNRTILRPTTLPAPVITLKTQTPLTRSEAVQALDAVLGLNGISMINIGDKFVKAVPIAQAPASGAAWSKRTNVNEFPDVGPYVTHVAQLSHARPSEIIAALQPFASAVPNPIMPIDSSGIIVLRDYTENVKRMLEMIDKIDVAVPSEFVSEVIPIKYALASEIASALNSLSTGGGGTTVGKAATGGTRTSFGQSRGAGTGTGNYPGGMQTTPGLNQPGSTQPNAPGAQGSFTDRLRNIIQRASVSGEIQVLGQTKIIADERTNALLIFAGKEDMKIIKDIVSKLDVVLAQVLIEAVIIEVQLGPDTKSFGVSYLQHPQTSGKLTGVGAGGAGTFYDFGSFVNAGGGTNLGNALAGGFNYFAKWNQDLDVTVSAITSDTRAKILQRPRIQTSHAVQAQLFVGQSRPYPTASYYGGGSFGGYSSIQQLQIGVTLDVTPLINPDGLVVMDIHQTIESYNGDVDIANVGKVPITSRKEAAAKVAVRDRDTIILGGLIETDKSKTHSGIPILMDIPVLGWLFRSTTSNETRTELLVLIRPTVLPTPEVAALTARVEKDKMPGVRGTEAEILDEEIQRVKKAKEAGKNIH
jgi:general secretion pathway protein D